VPVGTALFLGEVIFGSIGWGILHGSLVAAAGAVIVVLAALRVGGGHLARTLVGAILLGAAVGVVLGLAWPRAVYDALGVALVPGVDAAIRPLVVGAALWAIIGGVAGLVAGMRAGGGGRTWGGLLGGAILGVLVGAFTSIDFPVQVGGALGLTVTLIAWPALAALALRDHDWEALKRRFVPQASIDAAKETKTFVETRLPPWGRGPAKEDDR
jgi:hypothetical protein